MNRAPFHEIRRGLLQARIRRRRARNVDSYTVTVSRTFRDGDLWRESHRFSRDDLPLARLLLDEAYLWILQQEGSGTPAANRSSV